VKTGREKFSTGDDQRGRGGGLSSKSGKYDRKELGRECICVRSGRNNRPQEWLDNEELRFRVFLDLTEVGLREE
jgi:hypothetical protein